MQRPDYKQFFAISQSAIKAFRSGGLRKFKKIYIDKEEDDDDQDKYSFGSLADTLAFEPDLMEKRFFIPDEEVSIPGDKVKTIVDKVFREAKEIVDNKIKLNEQGSLPEPLHVPNLTDIYEWPELIIKYAREIKYGGTTWSSSRIIDNVYNDAHEYFRLLGQSNGRALITPIENADAIEVVDVLRNNKDTKDYFVQAENETLLFQVEMFVDYACQNMIIPLKGAVDILRFNHSEKWVQIADLKTVFNTDAFKWQVKEYGYIIQVSFYLYLLSEWLKTYKDGLYEDYEIRVPINIAIDRVNKLPQIYEYDWDDISIAKDGSEANNWTGWIEILNEIAWHIQTGIWDRSRELYENGKIKLKIFNK